MIHRDSLSQTTFCSVEAGQAHMPGSLSQDRLQCLPRLLGTKNEADFWVMFSCQPGRYAEQHFCTKHVVEILERGAGFRPSLTLWRWPSFSCSETACVHQDRSLQIAFSAPSCLHLSAQVARSPSMSCFNSFIEPAAHQKIHRRSALPLRIRAESLVLATPPAVSLSRSPTRKKTSKLSRRGERSSCSAAAKE